jgi:hypothetical protein
MRRTAILELFWNGKARGFTFGIGVSVTVMIGSAAIFFIGLLSL